MTKEIGVVELKAILVRPNEMTVMSTDEDHIPTAAKRMFNTLAWSTQMQARLCKPGQYPDYWEMTRAEFFRVSGIADTSISMINDYFTLLVKTTINFSDAARDKQTKVRPGLKDYGALLSEVSHSHVGLEPVVRWAFSPKIRDCILKNVIKNEDIDRGSFTREDLLMTAQLSSYAALSLYSICNRFRNSDYKVTTKDTIEWWIESVSRSGKCRNWACFKTEQLNDAIKEINEKTDLHIELEEEKEGRKITKAQFKVNKKSSFAPIVFTPALCEAWNGLEISRDELEALVRKHRERVVGPALLQLKDRLAMNIGVRSHAAYLKSIINASLTDVAKTEQVEERTSAEVKSQAAEEAKVEESARIAQAEKRYAERMAARTRAELKLQEMTDSEFDALTQSVIAKHPKSAEDIKDAGRTCGVFKLAFVNQLIADGV